MKEKQKSNELQRIDSLYDKISTLIEQARKSIVKNVNSIETYCKFETGKYIIEDELDGKYRASYGKKVLLLLSEKLTNKYGHGWSVETLTLCRKFYTVYSKRGRLTSLDGLFCYIVSKLPFIIIETS